MPGEDKNSSNQTAYTPSGLLSLCCSLFGATTAANDSIDSASSPLLPPEDTGNELPYGTGASGACEPTSKTSNHIEEVTIDEQYMRYLCNHFFTKYSSALPRKITIRDRISTILEYDQNYTATQADSNADSIIYTATDTFIQAYTDFKTSGNKEEQKLEKKINAALIKINHYTNSEHLKHAYKYQLEFKQHWQKFLRENLYFFDDEYCADFGCWPKQIKQCYKDNAISNKLRELLTQCEGAHKDQKSEELGLLMAELGRIRDIYEKILNKLAKEKNRSKSRLPSLTNLNEIERMREISRFLEKTSNNESPSNFTTASSSLHHEERLRQAAEKLQRLFPYTPKDNRIFDKESLRRIENLINTVADDIKKQDKGTREFDFMQILTAPSTRATYCYYQTENNPVIEVLNILISKLTQTLMSKLGEKHQTKTAATTPRP
jgi:hypothetical protein